MDVVAQKFAEAHPLLSLVFGKKVNEFGAFEEVLWGAKEKTLWVETSKGNSLLGEIGS